MPYRLKAALVIKAERTINRDELQRFNDNQQANRAVGFFCGKKPLTGYQKTTTAGQHRLPIAKITVTIGNTKIYKQPLNGCQRGFHATQSQN